MLEKKDAPFLKQQKLIFVLAKPGLSNSKEALVGVQAQYKYMHTQKVVLNKHSKQETVNLFCCCFFDY